MIAPHNTPKHQSTFPAVYERIQLATGTRTQTEIAELLEIRQSSISDAKKRNSIPSDWLMTLFRKMGINPDWLETGAGPMYLRTDKGYGASEGIEAIKTEYMNDPQASPIVVPVYSTHCRWKNDEDLPESDIIGRLALPRSYTGENIRVYRADSDALAPLIRKGAHVGVDISQRHPVSGEMFAVAMPPEGILFRRLWSQVSQDEETGAIQLVLRAEQTGHLGAILSTEHFLKCVVGRLLWNLQMF